MTAFVQNVTRNQPLASRGGILRNPLRQAIGTMFHALPGSYVFVFPWTTRVAITNLFVFQPLDILWLDDAGVVTHIYPNLRPFALHAGTPSPARFVIELPGGTIEKTGTQCGDQIAVPNLITPTMSARNLFKTPKRKPTNGSYSDGRRQTRSARKGRTAGQR